MSLTVGDRWLYRNRVTSTIGCAKLTDYDVVTTGPIHATRAQVMRRHLQELDDIMKLEPEIYSITTTVETIEHVPQPVQGVLKS